MAGSAEDIRRIPRAARRGVICRALTLSPAPSRAHRHRAAVSRGWRADAGAWGGVMHANGFATAVIHTQSPDVMPSATQVAWRDVLAFTILAYGLSWLWQRGDCAGDPRRRRAGSHCGHFAGYELGARRLGGGGGGVRAIQNDAHPQDAAPGHLGPERPPQVSGPANTVAVSKRTRCTAAGRCLIEVEDIIRSVIPSETE